MERRGLTPVEALVGLVIDFGDGTRLEVLHPPARPLEGTDADADNNSVVLRVVYGDVSFLLTGDIRAFAEGYLVGQGADLRSAVLKVPHHGSSTSSSGAFLEAVQPAVAVISAERDNPFGHPHAETIEPLRRRVSDEAIFLTSRQGTVLLFTDGERLWVKAEG